MTNPSFNDEHFATVETFEERYQGNQYVTSSQRSSGFECDFCAEKVSYSDRPRVSQYLTDRLPGENEHSQEFNKTGQLAPMATYCPDCSSEFLYLPCETYTEVRLQVTIDEQQILREPEITDISAHDDGIPWKPTNVVKQITETAYDDHELFGGSEHAIAPENVVTIFCSLGEGIDLREFVKMDGSLEPQHLGRARKQYQEIKSQVNSQGMHRSKFQNNIYSK